MKWRKCIGFEDYEVSNTGLVRSNKPMNKGRILAQMTNNMGYKKMKLSMNGEKTEVKVHRLVATAFCINPKGFRFVNHKDGNKANNNADNLEWCTSGDNQRHAYRTGLKPKRKPLAKITQEIANEIRSSKDTTKDLMAILKLDRSTINRIKKGTTWR